MERSTHIEQTGRKEAYIKPAITSHEPLRDLTANQSDCDNPLQANIGLHDECHDLHGEDKDHLNF